MVDFKKLHEDWYRDLDPESRARVDAHRAREKALDRQSKTIDGYFQRIGWARTSGPPLAASEAPKRAVEAEWMKPLKVRLETRQNNDGTLRDVVAFHGAVTGHEVYPLDADFVESMQEMASGEGLFCICAGTPTRYDACSVRAQDVLDLILEHRPDLVPAANRSSDRSESPSP